jgi:1,4-alpha-glucan branching enzyme
MALKKQYAKNKAHCKVTFTVPRELANGAKTVHLVGDFNQWNTGSTSMKRQRNGSFSTTIVLKPNAEYQYRFFVDGATWENDPQADKCVANEYGGENCVVVI